MTGPSSAVAPAIAAHAAADARRGARADGADIAHDVERNAYHEVADQEVEERRTRRGSRALQFIGLAFGFVYLTVGLRVVLEALGARDGNGFKQFVDGVSGIFTAPFEGLFPSASQGNLTLVWSYVAAFVAYLILHLVIHMVVRNIARRRTMV